MLHIYILGRKKDVDTHNMDWLVVSTHLKNISQNGNLPHNRGENKKYVKPPTSGGLDKNVNMTKSAICILIITWNPEVFFFM